MNVFGIKFNFAVNSVRIEIIISKRIGQVFLDE
jgi:hypothetical protein